MALYAFDGTSREDDIEDSRDTNVVRFARAYRGRRVYLSGVGTRFGAVGKVLGGWMGLGLHPRIGEAMDELRRNFAGGDAVIDIIGFSRGAAAARDFANEVWDDIAKKAPGAAPIRFVGLFDTVASTGILPGPLNLGLDLDIPANVGKCCHAMALDESRASFSLKRAEPRKGAKLPEGTIEEVWFRGCHSDIGGGQDHDALASIPFCWMMSRAASVGCQFDREEVELALAGRKGTAKIMRAKFDHKVGKRKAEKGDLVHCSVKHRDDHQNPPQRGCFVVDDHGELRGSYPGETKWPFDINWNAALQPAMRLTVGDAPVKVEVAAERFWNELPQVYLEAGGKYEFAVVDGPHNWIDGDVTETNGAEGYELPALKPFKKLARLDSAGWMALVGSVDRTDFFRIGKSNTFTPKQSGEFSCFANDAIFKYGNNKGRLTVAIKQSRLTPALDLLEAAVPLT